ncbi:MAG TPA: glucosyltransferase-I, partial [Polyangia bacterium]
GPIKGIWGSGPNDVYAVGAGPILHSTGNGMFVAQTQLFQHGLFGVWGSGASDVYAVGAESSVLHSAGDGAWAPDDPTMGAGTVHAIWGSGSGDVYVIGTNNDQVGVPAISHLP